MKSIVSMSLGLSLHQFSPHDTWMIHTNLKKNWIHSYTLSQHMTQSQSRCQNIVDREQKYSKSVLYKPIVKIQFNNTVTGKWVFTKENKVNFIIQLNLHDS